MKKIDDFLAKAHLFKVWIFLYFFCVILVCFMFYGLDFLVKEGIKRHSYYLKLGSILSIVFSLMGVLMISMQRKAVVFWEYAEFLEKEIDKATTKEQLEHIWYNEFNQLIEKCQGGPQIGEVKRIRSIIKTRYKYLKD